MTDKEAIDILKEIHDNDFYEDAHKELQAIFVVLNLIKAQQEKINLYNETEIALNNRIMDLEAELEKKDKIIDEMAKHIATSDSDLCQYLDMTTKCKYYAGENKKTCDDCIKEYFKKKCEEDK